MTAGADDRSLATAELVGALTYGQLRAFQVTAAAIGCAPSVALAEQVAQFALREHERFDRLRDHLGQLTDLAERVMERQRSRFDEFFDHVAMEEWLQAVAFLAVGLPIAADFTRAVAVAVDDDTSAVLTSALADRGELERFALGELRRMIDAGDDATMERLGHVVADVVGRAFTGFQGAVQDTDALGVLLAPSEGADAKDLAIEVLNAHRHRMVQLGLDELD